MLVGLDHRADVVDLENETIASSGDVGDGVRAGDGHRAAELAVLFEAHGADLGVLPVRGPAEGNSGCRGRIARRSCLLRSP